ncbi:MAG: radical SAM protein, partial [Candidatus Omnitrophica bacterium]|nr:radical SAM protein [Candidatus Omnitrophota bacterium]
MLIYEPQGRAREYSPYALNIYSACDHKCKYCYCLKLNPRFHDTEVTPRKDFLINLEKEAAKKSFWPQQVLLSFTADPYCKAELTFKNTQETLKILLKNNIPVAILTKGGERCLRDLEIFKKFGSHIKIGASLTFSSVNDSIKFEPGAALPDNRIKALATLSENGIRTWVSFEPVLSVKQTIEMLKKSLPYVNEYKIGQLNHFYYGNVYRVKHAELLNTI